jgi:hypothetical protein
MREQNPALGLSSDGDTAAPRSTLRIRGCAALWRPSAVSPDPFASASPLLAIARLRSLLAKAAARVAAGIRSATLGELLTWHLFLLAPTLAFKTGYLDTIWPGHELLADTSVWAADADALSLVLAGVRLFGSDILGLAGFVLVVWALGTRVPGIRLRHLAGTTLVLVTVLGGATWLCLEESGGFLTPELVSIAWYWVQDNPAVLLHFRPFRISVLIVVATLWWLTLRWVLRRSERGDRRPLLVPAALSMAGIAAALFVNTMTSTRSHDAGVARRGFWTAAVQGFLTTVPPSGGPSVDRDLPRAAQLEATMRGLSYPQGRPADPTSLAGLSTERRRPRHIVIVLLETAARGYYPLTNNPDFPTFAAMSRRAIVADHHYATRPFSTDANYSALSGVYPPSLRLGANPPASTQGLASILSAYGYDASYVDAYRFDWRGGNRQRRMWTNLGFSQLIELEPPGTRGERTYAARVRREEEAFRTAFEQIDAAERSNRKALVVVASALGHFEWKSRPEDRRLPPARKLYEIARVADRLTGELLDRLSRRGISDMMILVTGDHGLRYAAEFASLGEERRQAAARFNVPFLLYAPGLVANQIRLPYPTSHVDITPTLLSLVGVPTDGLLYHGENMLDPALAGRALFLLNARLAPFDYVVWKSGVYELDHLTGRVAADVEPAPADKLPGDQVRAMFDSATQLFDFTAMRFARDRGAEAQRAFSAQ